MSIQHKFQQHNFGNGFETHNSILDITPFKPEIIFIGTFNHGWEWNPADFFYGRGMYMWPALANMFLYNRNQITVKRTLKNNIPSLSQIFEICYRGKIVFADIVKGTKDNIITNINVESKSVEVNSEYNWSSYKDSQLDFMASRNWLDDNVNDIIDFVNSNKTIKHIYFTFKSGNWLVEKLNEICANVRPNVNCCSVFTPTANGFGTNLQTPFNARLWGLTHTWIWNSLNHNISVNRHGFGHLNHDWLIQNGVNPNNF